jgi:hypothetical protein
VKGATSLTNEEWCLQVDAPISSVYNLSVLPTEAETHYHVHMRIYTRTELDTYTRMHTHAAPLITQCGFTNDI